MGKKAPSLSHCSDLPLFRISHVTHTHARAKKRPVAHFVSDGEGDGQPRVLVDVAAAVRLTHPRQVRQTQGLAGVVHSCADVFPAGETRVNYVSTSSASNGRGASKRFHLGDLRRGNLHVCSRHSPGDQHGHVVVGRVRVTLRV